MCPKSDSWYSYIQKLQTRKLMENQYIVNGLCKVFQKVEYIIRFDFFHQKIKPTHATRTYFFQMQLKLCTFPQQIGALLTTSSLTTMGRETSSLQDSEFCDVNSSPVVCLRKDSFSIGLSSKCKAKVSRLMWFN